MNPEEILIHIQQTPNPYALKFVTNFLLKEKEAVTYQSINNCEHIPMARELLNLNGVEQVYFFENTLTLSHNGEVDLDILKDYATAVIKKTALIHDPKALEEKVIKKPKRKHTSKEIQEIEEILDRTIRSGLQADGGDIEVIDFKDNVISVSYQGACQGCPSAFTGTLAAIENILQTELKNDGIRVEPI